MIDNAEKGRIKLIFENNKNEQKLPCARKKAHQTFGL